MADALIEARNNAQRDFTNIATAARLKASAAALPALPGSTDFGDRQSLDSASAAEYYSHFKGWVYAAIRPIAQRIAGQTIHVGRVTSQRVPGTKAYELKQSLPGCYKSLGDRIEPLDSHPILDLLNDPNDLMVAWSLVYNLIAGLELAGRGYWWLTHDGNRRVIMPLPAHWVRGADRKSKYQTWYVQPPGLAEPQAVPAEEIIYFYYPDPSDPYASRSPLQAAANAVLTDEAIQGSQRNAFDRGLTPKIILTAGRLEDEAGGPGMRPVLTPAQRKQLVNAMKTAHAGWGKWEEPAIIDGLIERIDVLGRTVAEMDFQNSGEITKSRIFKAFGTNPIITGEVEGANRASSTVAEEHFCSMTVNPKIELISQTLTGWLNPMFRRGNERLVVWIEKCRAHDPEFMLRAMGVGRKNGDVSGNEFRRNILNLPDIDGGDEYAPPVTAPAGFASTNPEGLKGINPYTLAPMNGRT